MSKPITLANLKRSLGPNDSIRPGSGIFDELVGGLVDPCVACVEFGGEVVRMYVTQAGTFRVGSAQCPMSRDQLAACARAYSFVAKLGLVDGRSSK